LLPTCNIIIVLNQPTQHHSSYGHSLKFYVKLGKHNTKTLSLVQNRVRFKKDLQRSTLAFNRGWNSAMHHLLCQTEFHLFLTPSFLFLECFHYCYLYFHCSYMYNFYNHLDLVHSMLSFNIPYLDLIKLPYFVKWFLFLVITQH